MTRTPRPHRWLPALVGLVLLLAACGDDTAATTTTVAATTTTAALTTTTAAATTTTAAGATTTTSAPVTVGPVISIGDTSLGGVLVDPDGMTLYLRTDDSPTQSKCSGGCTSTWPPLTGEVGVGEGLDASLLGSLTRDDGSVQVTYNGWPLYRYAGDQVPGDTRGQGLGGIWFAVSPSGDPMNG